MKYDVKYIEISDIVNYYENDLYEKPIFQRANDVWKNKNKIFLIDSILKNYYIPPLLFSNKKILDGLQRINCLYEFIKCKKFQINISNDTNNNSKYWWSDLKSEYKEKILKSKLIIVNVTKDDGAELSDDEERELFIRINENSIKLNATEKFLAKCDYKIRDMINQICETENLCKIASNKKSKRFSFEKIISWCLTIIYYRSNGMLLRENKQKTSIRNLMMKTFVIEPIEKDDIDNMIKLSKKTIDLLFELIGDNIPPKSFKVIFTSIFIPLYENINSKNSFLDNREKLRKRISELYQYFEKNQQRGGIYYDSYIHIKERFEKVKEILDDYKIDDNRNFSQTTKKDAYWKNFEQNDFEIHCARCGKKLSDKEINFDHIKSYTTGGKTNLENCQILCEKCNKELGSKIKK